MYTLILLFSIIATNDSAGNYNYTPNVAMHAQVVEGFQSLESCTLAGNKAVIDSRKTLFKDYSSHVGVGAQFSCIQKLVPAENTKTAKENTKTTKNNKVK